jgi:hypothetical protein
MTYLKVHKVTDYMMKLCPDSPSPGYSLVLHKFSETCKHNRTSSFIFAFAVLKSACQNPSICGNDTTQEPRKVFSSNLIRGVKLLFVDFLHVFI